MIHQPSPNGANGRSAAGRFRPGNPGGPGNPYAKSVAEFRSILYEVLTPERMRAVAETLVRQAELGEQWAVKELLDRTIGKLREAEPETSPENVEPPKVVLLDWRTRPAASDPGG